MEMVDKEVKSDIAKVPTVPSSATMLISRTYKAGRVISSEEDSEEQLAIRVPPKEVPQAAVTFGVRTTINMGNFESVQIAVEVKLPCVVEEINDAYDAAKSFADVRLNKEVTDIREYKKSRDAKGKA